MKSDREDMTPRIRFTSSRATSNVTSLATIVQQKKFKRDNDICIVHAYAKWNPPCNDFKTTYEMMASGSDKIFDEVGFARFDVEENELLTDYMRIYQMPTFIIFLNGKEVARNEGVDAVWIRRNLQEFKYLKDQQIQEQKERERAARR